MRRYILALLFGALIFPVGCGAPEVANTAEEITPEGEAAREAARQQMQRASTARAPAECMGAHAPAETDVGLVAA